VIRRTLGACALLLLALPLRAQVVGHLPEDSPFADVTGRHLLGAQFGVFVAGSDPAGVALGSGLAFIGRYEYEVPGPLVLLARVAYVPGLERTVKDPLLTGDARIVGTRSESLVMFDVGMALNLTGEKAWRGLAPRVYGNLGVVGSTNSGFDVGGYRFGPKFMPNYGVAVRGVREGKWEWYADLNHLLWRTQYPNSYTDDGATVQPSIIGNSKTNPWSGNLMLTVGITRVWGK
jgi:hypothetical protein